MTSEITFKNDIAFIFPLRELERKLHKKHSTQRPLVEKLINDFVTENGSGYIMLTELLLKAMEADLNIYEFTKDDIEDFKTQINNLDKKFKYIDRIMDQLPKKEKWELWLDRYNNLTELLSKRTYLVRDYLISKENPNEVDVLFFSYYLHFVRLMGVLTQEIRKLNENEFEHIVPTLNIAMMLYAPLLIGYTNQKLKKEVLIDRLSELAIFNEPMPHKTKRSIKPLLEISERIPACPE